MDSAVPATNSGEKSLFSEKNILIFILIALLILSFIGFNFAALTAALMSEGGLMEIFSSFLIVVF